MDELKMPWAGIAKFTGMVAAGTFLAAAGLCKAALNHQREEERRKNRWTDAARWEKPGRDY